jgi:hypothetical protein
MEYQEKSASPMREIKNPRRGDPMRRLKSTNISMREVKMDRVLVVQLEDPDPEFPERDLYFNTVLKSDGDDEKDPDGTVVSLVNEVCAAINGVGPDEVVVGIKIKFSSRDLLGKMIAEALHERLMDVLIEGMEA